jgi:magnesium chelatase family protein
MRRPLEDKLVTISRVTGTLTFPANFMLVAAINPCPCGYFGDPVKECTCSPSMITRYRKRDSGPLLDRSAQPLALRGRHPRRSAARGL